MRWAFIRPWLRVAAWYLVIFVLCAGTQFVVMGKVGVPWFAIVVVGAAIAFTASRLVGSRADFEAALDLRSADAVAHVWYGKVRNAKDPLATPIVVAGTAQLHAIYGNLERAEDLLRLVDWRSVPQLGRDQHDYTRAVMEHIRGNHEAALRVAPAHMTYVVDLGKMLAQDDRDAAKRLDAPNLPKTLRLHRGFVAWALARAHARWGDEAAAAKWLAMSRVALPFAYGLGVPRPVDAPTASVPTIDPSNPYAAPAHPRAPSDPPFDVLPDPEARRR